MYKKTFVTKKLTFVYRKFKKSYVTSLQQKETIYLRELKMYKMKKIVFLMVVVSLGLFSCKSNYTRIGDKNANYIPYYLKVYEADSLYIIGEYKNSYKILDSLFKKYEPINMPIYFEYEQYIKLANRFDKKTKKNIKKIIFLK